MKILGLNISRDKPEKRGQPFYNPNLSESLGWGFGYQSGSAMSLSAVYCAVNLISDSIATLPIQVKAKNTKGTDLLDKHPLYDIFTNNRMTRYTLLKNIVQSVLLKGNAYVLIEKKGKDVVGLRYLPADDVQCIYRKEDNTLYYTCSYIGARQIQPSEILHFLRYSVDGVQGISVLSHAARSLNIAQQTEQVAENFFSNGCNLNGIIKVHSNLSEEQKQAISTNWRSTFGQGNQGGGVVVLPVNMDYQPISINGSDAQMLESRNFSVVDIARFFNISPVLLGDLSKSSYSSVGESNLQYLTYTLNPYIVMIEEELNRKLTGGTGLELGLDETAILRTNKAELAGYYNSLLSMGVLSINEVRKQLGYNPVENGDSHNLAYNDVSKTNLTDNTEDEKQE